MTLRKAIKPKVKKKKFVIVVASCRISFVGVIVGMLSKSITTAKGCKGVKASK